MSRWTLIGEALARSWGECLWTAPDLLKQPVKGSGVSIVVGPRADEPPPRRILVLIGNEWLRA